MWEKVGVKLIMNVLFKLIYPCDACIVQIHRQSSVHWSPEQMTLWWIGIRSMVREVQEVEEIVGNVARSERTRHIESLCA